jgi:hypothetical protein
MPAYTPFERGFAKSSADLREALGSKRQNANSAKALATAGKISRNIRDIAKRSGRSAQVIAPADSSPVFGNDSRTAGFYFFSCSFGPRASSSLMIMSESVE